MKLVNFQYLRLIIIKKINLIRFYNKCMIEINVNDTLFLHTCGAFIRMTT